MIFNTASGPVPLAPSPLVNLPLVQSASNELNVLRVTELVQPTLPVNAINSREAKDNLEKSRPGANTPNAVSTRTENSLFFAQIFGSELPENISAAQAAARYKNALTPQRQYSPSLSPEKLQEFSDVKYKPLKPPVNENRLSITI